MARLLLVRHGEAEGNSEHRFIGQSATPLTDRGHLQARALAARLQQHPVAAIHHSDLARVEQTVAPLAAATGLDPEADSRWREIASGEWTGLTPGEIAAGWPDLWESYAAGHDVARPGGESWADVRARVGAALADVREAHAADEVVVIATHGGPIAACLQWAAGLPSTGGVFASPFRAVANASVTIIDTSPRQPRIVAVNDTGHLV